MVGLVYIRKCEKASRPSRLNVDHDWNESVITQ